MSSNVAMAGAARELLDDLKVYISKAKEIVAQGDYIELEGLDKQVHRMCQAISTLSVEESRQFKDELDELMIDLDELQQRFVASRDALGKELSGVSKHKQASVAYKQSEHGPRREGTVKPEGEDE